MMKNSKKVLLGLMAGILLVFTGCGKKDDPETQASSATTVCDSTEMEDLTNVVDSEEELIDLVTEVAKEITALNSSPDVNAYARMAEAATPEAAVKQIEDYVVSFINAIQNATTDIGVEDLMNMDFDNASIAKIITSLNNMKFNFEFDKSINIGEIKFSDWIDATSQALEDFYTKFGTEVDNTITEIEETEKGEEIKEYISKYFDESLTELPKTAADIKQAIYDSIEMGNKKGDEAVSLYDKYFSIKNVGLDTKVKINIDIAKYLSADEDYMKDSIVDFDLGGKLSIGVKNLSKLYAEAFEDTEVLFPVKGITVSGNGSAKLQLTGNDVQSWVTLISNSDNFLGNIFGSNIDPTVTAASVSGSQELLMAVCTEAGNGGYFTVTAKENADAAAIIDSLDTLISESDEDKLEEELTNYLDKCVSVTISVSDGEKEVWKQDYSLKTFLEFLDNFESETEVEVEE